MSVAYFVNRYLISSKKIAKKIQFDPTVKWAEHSLAIYEMHKMIPDILDYEERAKIRRAIDVAERKKAWHYNRDDFDLRRASFLFETAKNAAIVE
jgi:hypothetical protein